MASSGSVMLDGFAVDLDRAARGRRDAEDGARDIGAAGADQPAEADDLALAHCQS